MAARSSGNPSRRPPAKASGPHPTAPQVCFLHCHCSSRLCHKVAAMKDRLSFLKTLIYSKSSPRAAPRLHWSSCQSPVSLSPSLFISPASSRVSAKESSAPLKQVATAAEAQVTTSPGARQVRRSARPVVLAVAGAPRAMFQQVRGPLQQQRLRIHSLLYTVAIKSWLWTALGQRSGSRSVFLM